MNSSTTDTRIITEQPAYTTREDETGVHLQVALPGVRKEDVKLTLKQAILQIAATRTSEVPDTWRSHSSYPATLSYQLNVRLTSKLDGSNVTAALENGVLTVGIPVREEAKPREISVN